MAFMSELLAKKRPMTRREAKVFFAMEAKYRGANRKLTYDGIRGWVQNERWYMKAQPCSTHTALDRQDNRRWSPHQARSHDRKKGQHGHHRTPQHRRWNPDHRESQRAERALDHGHDQPAIHAADDNAVEALEHLVLEIVRLGQKLRRSL